MIENSKIRHETKASIIDKEIVITRTFNASRALIFKTWTEAEHLQHWWGPQGFTITTQEIDVSPGGVWRYIMHGPDGTDYDNKIIYREVVNQEKLVYSHGDSEVDEWHRVTATFVEQGNQTVVTMKLLFSTVEDLEKVVKEYGAIEAAKSTFDRLEEHLQLSFKGSEG